MNILVLEDEDYKYKLVENEILSFLSDAKITRVSNWLDYSRVLANKNFDLILLDLLVPRSSRDNTIEDHSSTLVETTRDYSSKSFKTPAIVLTQHSLDEGSFVGDLNLVDINVIPFNDYGQWKEALKIKLIAAQPPQKFDVVIFCALEKEANAYEGLTDTWGPLKTISGLICREVRIGEFNVVIVRANRMGLVAAAIGSALAIERFEPRLICMSGICGGVADVTKIYDVLITQTCHQHDAGKWSKDGFKSEHYDVQLDISIHYKLIEIASNDTIRNLYAGIDAAAEELPRNKNILNGNVITDAITSSGSAVVAEDGRISSLSVGQRKLSGFDMEIYSVYEAARHAHNRTAFFAAKTVVDDGGSNKGDDFHRIGCLLSAKFVVEAIKCGISNVWEQ
ncbi:5'-methylthioadenosine/S-adenosylhomocysteine nucleosidase [Klebsiella quasipneumoniae]|uniref:5'-methylthioadenosine/S-adenosylhomocysteine nucleosidase family protein n=1 Tax=Klebsiella quasipneumoniae TaxID=1463165 RepID=UPI00111A2B2C|nr:5'-methylthioadenosine/S-adenosylhomocysteine nucleosidase [Klebsiella quasipneumoniae]SNQ41574.1 5'-methylthioadenosine/S-adenosylhomocysteine nucleosidase [Klebsiella quasipneumoniae]HCB1270131.1 response regulator [Klebsiella quasipneumoniae subsp. quasipneumoniae]